jgi:acetolactate synthase I/II/III large subunit
MPNIAVSIPGSLGSAWGEQTATTDSAERAEGTRSITVGEDRLQTAAQLLVQCLENEGVEYVFGIPGEENIRFVDALEGSKIRFITVRHEQGASFMAEMYGRVTGRAGVCAATLGPGAINLLLGTADAYANSTPLVAVSAQVGLGRIHKETHQIVDLLSMFKPVTKWAELIVTPGAIPEMVRQAFQKAERLRPGATYLGVPEDMETVSGLSGLRPIPHSEEPDYPPSQVSISRAANILDSAIRPIVLAGHGAARVHAQKALIRLAEGLHIPVATTFMGKGVFPDNHPLALGTMGFMRHDLVNFGFDEADVIVCVGYDLQEFDPVRMNPEGAKKIIHVHTYPAEVDAHYTVTASVWGNISMALDGLAAAVTPKKGLDVTDTRIRRLLREELEWGARADEYPVKPQRLVADIRAAMGEADVALVDTGALKMWMARLYPTYQPNTCLISNGLATMAFAVPGAIGVKLACPDRKVLAVTGDGSFMMNSQELETAVRERIPFVVLIWEDKAYGLIKWKMDLELGRHSAVDFTNPDLVKYAESFGIKAYRIRAAADLLPTLKEALGEGTVSVIVCPVDYSENIKLTDKLGQLTEPL